MLAAERTYAAWVRTGLTALAAGVGARALPDAVVPLWLAMATGNVLILFSAFCFVAAVWRQMMKVSPPRPPASDAPRLPSWLLIFINRFLSLVGFTALIGIWTA